MKKIVSVILAIAVVFTLSACGQKNNSSNSNFLAQSEVFTAPENYTAVLIVTIKPQFKLYLDENNNVLAVEPVNDDAKTFSDKIDFKNKSVETVVGALVEKANENGFVKENAAINIEIVEQRTANNESSDENILQRVVSAAEHKAAELNITVTVEAKKLNSNSSFNEELNESVASGNTTSVPSSSVVQPSGSTASKVNSTHTHKYSSATCTEAPKCACGATAGKALGHYYQNGKCARCSAKDPNASFTSVLKKKGEWKLDYFVADSNANLYAFTFLFVEDESGFGCFFEAASNLKNLDKAVQESIKKDEADAIVTFNNEEYYFNRGDGDTILMAENQNTVTVNGTNENSGKLVLTRTAENKMVVSQSEGKFFGVAIPVGKQLVFKSK